MTYDHICARPTPRALGTLMSTLAAMLAFATSGCVHHVYSPPTRMLPLEDAFGPSAGGVDVGATASASGEAFGPTIAATGLHLDVGVDEHLDLVGEGTWMQVTADSGDAPLGNPRRDGVSGRAGLRLTLAQTERAPNETLPLLLGLALTSGFGGGSTAVGTFIAPDVGLSFSLRSSTGFDLSTGLRTWTSVPIVRRSFRWTEDELSNEPAPTFGVGYTVQGAVPLVLDAARHGEPRVRLVLGLGVAYVADGADNAYFMQLGGGLEARLD